MLRRSFLFSMGSLALAGLSPARALVRADTPLIEMVGAENSLPFSARSGDQTIGYLPDIIEATCAMSPVIDCNLALYPWSRAQWLVEEGAADAFCTFPSEERQQYALFTPSPAFNWDFGNLVFRRDNPNARRIANAQSWEDLRGLTFVGQYNTGWEDDNVPDFLEKQQFSNQREMLLVLIKRQVGDFLIMNPLEASYLIWNLSLSDVVQQARVTFIENRLIPFHFGFSKQHKQAESLVNQFEQRITDPAYIEARRRIEAAYTELPDNLL